MTTTLDLIQKIATERQNLYRQASEQHLTPVQLQRLHEITNELPILWDRHRREVASRSYRQPTTLDALRAAA